MDRVYQSNAIETPPSSVASSGSYPTAGNKASGQLATVPGPYWFYSITEEIRNAIISAGLTPDSAKVNQLAEAMAKFLPLSGGMVTGDVISSSGMVYRVGSSASRMGLFGGTTETDGAILILSGKSRSGSEGNFTISARNGTDTKNLTGTPAGDLYWDGNELEIVDSHGNNWIRYVSGLQMCWGTGQLASGTAKETVTYPVAFVSTNKQIVNAGSGSAGCIVSAGARTTTSFEVFSVTWQNLATQVRNYSYIAVGYWK